MGSTLLKTKLYKPQVSTRLVRRSRQMKLLDEGLDRKLTLVSAPAGYGKTTLLSAWAAGCGCRVTWLSLDAGDNDPARFLAYLVAAFQAIEPDIGTECQSLIQAPQPVKIEELLPILINQLVDIAGPFVLVLDDYQSITSPEIHRALAFLLNHQPQAMHLVISTRADPPLPTAQLRARGQLTELRQADLRFTVEEAKAFLHDCMGLVIRDADAGILLDRTEGWIAGLQLAALSMRNQEDVSRFIADFGGSHEYVVDFFASEILASLPEPTVTFLIKTSIMDELCGDLCDTILGRTDSQQTLENLQEANLFLVPLDDEHHWYRYHQLFADLLQKRIKQWYLSEIPDLYRRASQWFKQNNFPLQAIKHAFSARDYPLAASLLDEEVYPALGRGELILILRWLDQLPVEMLEAHPRLNVVRVAILVSAGKTRAADSALQKIEIQMRTQTLDAVTQDYMIGRVRALRAMVALEKGEVDQARRNAQLAMEKLVPGIPADAPWIADSLLALGMADFALGNLTEARQNLEMAKKNAFAAGHAFTFLYISKCCIEVLWLQGNLRKAADVCQECLKYIDQYHLGYASMSGEIMLGRCLILCEGYELDQVKNQLGRGLELVRSGGVAWDLVWAQYIQMCYWIAKGDLSTAEATAQEIERLHEITDLPVRIASSYSALRVIVCIKMGKLEQAEKLLRLRGVWTVTEILYAYQHEYRALAALLIARGDFESAETLLERLIDWAEGIEQIRTLICARTLQALVFAVRNNKEKALHSLQLALDLAEPEGYMMAVLEAGDAIIPLLYEAGQKGIHSDYVTRLIERYLEAQPNPDILLEAQKRSPERSVPLRERELEVLRLAADGQTNKEIASRLHISIRTVKYHMANIFNKLGVENRAQATSKARKLGIVR